ncbi:MAG: hypothetical protein JXR91_01430, partial [Deltaproteobacteria bacterium]|nr:hypothetical protein [Deltaproteobacteria bacterium]
MKNLPDLLNNNPVLFSKSVSFKDGLNYAFTTGDSSGALSHLLDDETVCESYFDRDCFYEDLFIDDLIEKCFMHHDKDQKPYNLQFLKTVLCTPPADLNTTIFRQDIAGELLHNKEYRAVFTNIYKDLVDLRDEFDSQSIMGPMFFTRRRIDILTDMKSAIDDMAAAFKDASSGLVRISNWATELQSTQGYKKLAEFLDYEDNLAVANLEVKVAADGSVRGFKVLKLDENSKNYFYEGPVKRFFVKLGLILRGYKVSGEGLVARWIEHVFEETGEDFSHFIGLIGSMEFYLASLMFTDLCKKEKLPFCLP